MRFQTLASLVVTASLLSACSIFKKPESPSSSEPSSGPSGTPSQGPGSAQPQPVPPSQPGAVPEAPRPPPKQFRLGPATSALVQQAHQQEHAGAFVPAAGTLERALRIEPENPLLWIELGQVRLSENNPGQANSTGPKALALATGDPQAQASAWRLIADSLRALNRNEEAAEADKKAGMLSPR